MLINGAGITEVQCKVVPGYKVNTRLALQWVQLASGNWVATDRGATEDVYEADINVKPDTEAIINNILNQIQLNRVYAGAGANAITLSDFATSEYIFGENVVHTSVPATILEMPKRVQLTWKTYGISMKVRATGSRTFTGTSSLPVLSWCDTGGEQDEDLTVKKADCYDGTMAYSDHRSDSGVFEGVFTLSTADMVKIRNYIKTQRSGDFTLANTFGVAYPFGPRSIGTYPFTCKLIDWEDLGWFGLKYHCIRLRFAEAL
jgi:hypothetical protein